MAAAAILFDMDMDDTLLDWPTAIDRAIEGGLVAAGLPAERLASASVWEEIRACTWLRRDGRVVDRAHWRLLFEPQVPWERAFPFEPRRAVADGARRFRELLDVPLFSDAVAALDQLGSRYQLGVLSNSPTAKYALTNLGLASRFAAITMADDPFRKPHRKAFEDACHALGVGADAAIYVGDSFANDIEGALDAGMRAVWVDRFGDGHPLPFGAWRVDRLSKLPDVIESFA